MSSLVTVGVPLYNGSQFIKETLERILAQDYNNIEVLVSDDCSSDNSIEIVESINDPRIRIIKNDSNVGISENWNRLVKCAKGDYFILICQDDYILPGAIRAKAEILDKNPDVNIVFSSSYVMNSKGKKLLYRRPYKKSQKLEGSLVQKELFVKRNFFAEPPNNMMRKSAMNQIGEYDKNLWYTVDWDYYIRILGTGNAYYIDYPYEGFRISISSTSGSNLFGEERILKDEKVFVEKYKNGNYLAITEDMLKKRKKNVENRLKLKIVFMKVGTSLSLIQKY